MADESQPHDGLDEIDPALFWPARFYINEKGKRVLEFKWIWASGTTTHPDSINEFVQLRKAGRYTLGEVAVGLEEKTGVPAKRWFETIEAAVIAGELKLKNYYSLADNLPYQASSLSYRPGKVWDYEHVLADDINRWLDSHPEYGASFRFDIGLIAEDKQSPHKAALARHGYTANDKKQAKTKARKLWGTDKTISQKKMRQLCGINGKSCPES